MSRDRGRKKETERELSSPSEKSNVLKGKVGLQ